MEGASRTTFTLVSLLNESNSSLAFLSEPQLFGSGGENFRNFGGARSPVSASRHNFWTLTPIFKLQKSKTQNYWWGKWPPSPPLFSAPGWRFLASCSTSKTWDWENLGVMLDRKTKKNRCKQDQWLISLVSSRGGKQGGWGWSLAPPIILSFTFFKFKNWS